MREKGKERGVADKNKRVVRLSVQEVAQIRAEAPRQCFGVGCTCHVNLIMGKLS
jgi:hypothetical protein